MLLFECNVVRPISTILFAVPFFWDCLSIRFGNCDLTTLQTGVRLLTIGNCARWDLGADF